MKPPLYPHLIIDISCQGEVRVCSHDDPTLGNGFLGRIRYIISCWFCRRSLSKVVIEVSLKTGIVAWHVVLLFFVQVLRVRDC